MVDNKSVDRAKLLREIQLTQLKSLHKLDEVCKKYGLQYWAHGGTMLGAMRHQGFIPWDDDIDVGMMRGDFEKLCKVPASEWEPGFIFCGPDSDEVFHDKCFGRIYVKGTHIQSYFDVENRRNWEDNKSWSTLLMCDIFVYDFVPDDGNELEKLHREIYEITGKKYALTKIKAYTTSRDPVKIAKTAAKVAYGRYMRARFKKPWKYLNHVVRRKIAGHQTGNRIGCYNFRTTRLYAPYENFFPLRKVKFEDMEIPVPNMVEERLRTQFGDWMTPPPDSEKTHINFIYVDLGDGRKYVLDPVKGSLGNP